MVDNKPWFVAKDVCSVLEISNVGNALARLDDDEKTSIRLTDVSMGTPYVAVVNEPGLYSLILRSRKPEAKAFKRWVTHEVLPSICETGMYMGGDTVKRSIPRDYLSALKELVVAEEERLVLVMENERKEGIIAEQAQIVERHLVMTDSDGLITGNHLAKLLGIGPREMYNFLRKVGFFIKDDTIAYQKYINAGYCITVSTTRFIKDRYHTHLSTRFTQKGADYVAGRYARYSRNGG